jgi:hypothetical protein
MVVGVLVQLSVSRVDLILLERLVLTTATLLKGKKMKKNVYYELL